MGDKSATNLLDSIEHSKSTTIARFIHSLGIRNVGFHTSKILEKFYRGDLNKLMTASIEELTNIHEIGTIVAKSIEAFFQNESSCFIIKECIEKGVQFYNT